MEHWSEDFIETVSEGNARVIEVSNGMPTVLEKSDPHSWLDVDNALYAMEMVKNELKALDRENALYYEENYKKAVEKAESLRQDFNNTSGGTIVVTHGAYGYLCDEMNIEQLSLEGIMGDGEPTPSDIVNAAKTIKEKGIKYIFAEKYGTDKVAKSLAEEVGAEILELDAFERGDGSNGYFEVMEENISNIKLALE